MDLPLRQFGAGELSPEMKGRTDLEEYYAGCRTMQGFVPTPTGAAVRCPGFECIGEVADSADETRIIPFVHKAVYYILEFGDEVMRVYKDGALVLDGDSPYELETPWSDSEVFDLVFAARGQAIFHPNHDIYELACGGDDDWTLTAANFGQGPFQTENDDQDLTITPSDVTGDITLTASADLWVDGDIGALVTLTQFVGPTWVSGNITVLPGSGDSLAVKGDWELSLLIDGDATVALQRSYDGGATWSDYRVYQSEMGTSVVWLNGHTLYLFYEVGTESDDSVLYRVSATGTALVVNYKIDSAAHYQKGVVRITDVDTAKLADAEVVYVLGGTDATWQWSKGAWSTVLGYPRCGTIHEGRIYAAATVDQPTTIWAFNTFKRIGDADIMTFGVNADDAFTRTIDLVGSDSIQWLDSVWPLLVGTNGNIVKGIGPTPDSAMTPSDATFLRQCGMGSAAIQPVDAAGRTVYAGRNHKRVYELTYSDDRKTYEPEDLTEFAEHICGSGLAGLAFQQQPYPILWGWTDDGQLIGMTRNARTGQKGWFRRVTDGSFESVIVSPGDGDDEVWAVVAREVGGATKRYVERMKGFDHWTTQADCFYVDAGSEFDGGAAVTITGIAVAEGTGKVTVTAAAHGLSDGWTVKLAGVEGMTDVNGRVYTVADKAAGTFILKTRDGSAYIDGSGFTEYDSGGTAQRVANGMTGLTQLASETVSVLLDGQPGEGTVTAEGAYVIGVYDRHFVNRIIVGRPYTSILEPMPIEAMTYRGTLQGVKKKVVSVGMRLHNSAGGRMGTDATDMGDIDYSQPGDSANEPTALVSEDVYAMHPGGWQRAGHVRIDTSDPLPLEVTALVLEVEA